MIRRFVRHRLQLNPTPTQLGALTLQSIFDSYNKEISLQTYIESEGNRIMLEYIIVAALAIVAVSVIVLFGGRRSKVTGRSSAPPNVYDKSYAPGMIGSTAGPLPVRGRTERKKTETFRQHSDN
ncbi:MAG: hypothetical protein V3T87_00900 [Candidatus Thorarchaeota archaeon]